MSILKIYRYKEQVVIPTIAQNEHGLLVECSPVAICDVEDPRMPDVIQEALSREVLPEQNDDHDEGPKSVVLESLKLKKWRDLEQSAILYTIFRSDSAIQVHSTGRGADGSWTRDDSLMVNFPLDSTDQSLSRSLAKVIADRKPVQDKPVRLLGGPPALPPALPPPQSSS